jgi:hypothetical protein
MFYRLICLLLASFLLAGFSAPAKSDELSRQWEHHFWIHEHTDLNLKVFHLPNGTIRVRGRFSNGIQTVDRTISATVFIENDAGEIWHMTINERVPMTLLGGTQVRFKEQDMAITGSVTKVSAIASIINRGESFGLGIKCKGDGSPDTSCNWDLKYENKPDKIIESAHPLTEREMVNICSGFQSNTWVNIPAQTGNWTECNPRTGAISEHSRVLEHPIYPCEGCPLP